jgi:hypothetical protein
MFKKSLFKKVFEKNNFLIQFLIEQLKIDNPYIRKNNAMLQNINQNHLKFLPLIEWDQFFINELI